MSGDRWCDRHPRFTRYYVPLVVSVTFLMHLWEVLR